MGQGTGDLPVTIFLEVQKPHCSVSMPRSNNFSTLQATNIAKEDEWKLLKSISRKACRNTEVTHLLYYSTSFKPQWRYFASLNQLTICSIPESVCAPESTTDSLVAPSFFAFTTVFGISSYTAGVFWASRCQARSALGRHMQPGSQCLREGGSPGGPMAGDCCHGKCTPEVRKVEKTSFTMKVISMIFT